MKHLATMLLALLLAGTLQPAIGQITEREDILWARFIEGDAPTIDGQIDEAVWDQAEEIVINYGAVDALPGGGWWFGRDGSSINPELAEPTDPPMGTFKFLAQGDSLYIAGTIQDASIGGSRSLWDFDAIFLPIRNKMAFGPSGDGFHWFNTQTIEIMYGWWNDIDTTDTGLPAPGIDPYPHTSFEALGWRNNRQDDGVRPDRTEEQMTNWEMAAVIDGTANDDTHGEDGGWTFEMRINLAALGYDLDDSDGAVVEMGVAFQDADFWWPTDADKGATSRAWFQAPFANTFAGDRSGSIKVRTDPSVTVDSGAPPTVGPDYLVPNIGAFTAPTVDGTLDDEAWTETQPLLQIQYGNQALLDVLPEPIRYQSGWFRPGASEEVTVVDPSLATVKWFYEGNMLYLGIDVEDQAIDVEEGEAGDGLRVSLSDLDAVDELGHNLTNREFIVTVDENGGARLEGYFAQLVQDGMENTFEVALSMKEKGDGTGASTPGDPSDVDAGYQIEMALDLNAILGYPADPTGNLLFAGFNLFDSDEFEDAGLNYRTVTWRFRERSTGPGAVARLDADAQVAVDDTGEVPSQIRLYGNYPNPFNPSTTLRYALPATGDVTVQVFDVLGRVVGRLTPGMQAAGEQQLRFDATGLASGMYLYRIQVQDATGQVRQSITGRMLLVK